MEKLNTALAAVDIKTNAAFALVRLFLRIA